jgi:hypothetical protein
MDRIRKLFTPSSCLRKIIFKRFQLPNTMYPTFETQIVDPSPVMYFEKDPQRNGYQDAISLASSSFP